MRLKELLDNLYPIPIPDRFKDIEIKELTCDSRHVRPSSLFVAVRGTTRDGSEFIPQAIEKGAVVVIRDGFPVDVQAEQNVCFLSVPDTKKFVVDLAQKFFDYPAQKIKTIGVTGTNGKTTVTYLMEAIFQNVQRKCAVIGTVNYRIGNKISPSKNTTPGLIEMQHSLADMQKENAEYCVVEVSSHALDQGRVAGIDFSTAVFTNLTQDHLDYHRDMEEYFQAKAKLFAGLSSRAYGIVNIDDSYGRRLLAMTEARLLTYSIRQKADIQATEIYLTLKGTNFDIFYPSGKINIDVPLVGVHNVYNILAAFGAGLVNGIKPEDMKKAFEKFSPVPGRLQPVDAGQDFFTFVDYAHTDDALKNVLLSFRTVSKARIILVFGCGGNRDKSKRSKMGQVASRLADYTIITSDNPRQENPQVIAENILEGFEGNNYEVILDRKGAIQRALRLARKGEIVLIAGKGHEDSQIFPDRIVPFNDCEITRECLRYLD